MNKNSLMYWWPKVNNLGIPVPKTLILEVDAYSMMGPLDGKEFPEEIIKKVSEMAAFGIGYPLFLRTDLQSGKHGWKNTCYVPNAGALIANLAGVVEENELGACSFGPQFEALVFREFLNLDTSFIAFYGDMPVNKERRYFIRNGEVVCHHPYWPEHAIKGHTKARNWKQELAVLNHESPAEVLLLSQYARKVSAVMPEYWSVDFAADGAGRWYLIDMALGEQSYHWPECGEQLEAMAVGK